MKYNSTLWLGFLLPMLIGCQSQSFESQSFKKIALKELPNTHWRSSGLSFVSDSIQLVITPSTFRFHHCLSTSTRVEPYRLLANSQLLLGEDTVELYLKRGHLLCIRPTNRAIAAAESIQVIYATDFLPE